MDEGTVLALVDGSAVMFVRTPEGHVWETRSTDDGRTWSEPKPTPLVHPDAPPMVFQLADGRTLIALIHNRHDPLAPLQDFRPQRNLGRAVARRRAHLERAAVRLRGSSRGRAGAVPQLLVRRSVGGRSGLALVPQSTGAQLLHLTFRESDLAGFPTKAELQNRAAQDRIAQEITVGGVRISTAAPPRGVKLRAELGLLTAADVRGQIVHRAAPGKDVYETRAVITPGGDFLLMFPEGKHYGRSKGEKVNDMLACRSSDKGETWTEPKVAFDINYNQHGFVPLIPRGTKRIYAFGTQPIPGKWSPEKGLHETRPSVSGGRTTMATRGPT